MVKKRIIVLILIVAMLCAMYTPTHAIAGEIIIGGGAALAAILMAAGATVTFMDAARPAIDKVADWFDSLGSNVTATVDPATGTVSMSADDYNNSLAFIQEWNANNAYIEPAPLNFTQAQYLEYAQISGIEKGTIGFINGVPNTFTPAISMTTASNASDIFVASKAFQFDAETYPDGTTVNFSVGALYNGNRPYFRFGRYAGTASNRYGALQYYNATTASWSHYRYIGDTGLEQDLLVDDVRDTIFRVSLGISKDTSNSGSPASVGVIYPIYGTMPKLVASNGALTDTGFHQNIPSNEELEEKKLPAGTGKISWRPTTTDGNNALEGADASNAEIILLQSYLNGGGSSDPEPDDPDRLPYIPFLTGISSKLDGIKDALNNSIGSLLGSIVNWLSNIKDAIIEFKDRVGEWLTNLGQLIIDFKNSVGTWFTNLGQSIIDFKNSTATKLDTLINNFIQYFTVGGQRLGDWFEGVWNNITGFFSDVRTKLDTIIDKLPGSATGDPSDPDNPDNTDEVPNKLTQFFNGLGLFPIADLFGDIWGYVRAWVGSLAPGLAVFQNIWSHLPYAMVVPMYAAAVIILVVGVFKRYIS